MNVDKDRYIVLLEDALNDVEKERDKLAGYISAADRELAEMWRVPDEARKASAGTRWGETVTVMDRVEAARAALIGEEK